MDVALRRGLCTAPRRLRWGVTGDDTAALCVAPLGDPLHRVVGMMMEFPSCDAAATLTETSVEADTVDMVPIATAPEEQRTLFACALTSNEIAFVDPMAAEGTDSDAAVGTVTMRVPVRRPYSLGAVDGSLCVGTRYGSLGQVDIATGQVVATRPIKEAASLPISRLRCGSPYEITMSVHHTLLLFDARQGAVTASCRWATHDTLCSFDVADSCYEVFAVTEEGRIVIWDTRKAGLGAAPVDVSDTIGCTLRDIRCLPSSNSFVTVGGNGATLLWSGAPRGTHTLGGEAGAGFAYTPQLIGSETMGPNRKGKVAVDVMLTKKSLVVATADESGTIEVLLSRQ